MLRKKLVTWIWGYQLEERPESPHKLQDYMGCTQVRPWMPGEVEATQIKHQNEL